MKQISHRKTIVVLDYESYTRTDQLKKKNNEADSKKIYVNELILHGLSIQTIQSYFTKTD